MYVTAIRTNTATATMYYCQWWSAGHALIFTATPSNLWTAMFKMLVDTVNERHSENKESEWCNHVKSGPWKSCSPFCGSAVFYISTILSYDICKRGRLRPPKSNSRSEARLEKNALNLQPIMFAVVAELWHLQKPPQRACFLSTEVRGTLPSCV